MPHNSAQIVSVIKVLFPSRKSVLAKANAA